MIGPGGLVPGVGLDGLGPKPSSPPPKKGFFFSNRDAQHHHHLCLKEELSL